MSECSVNMVKLYNGKSPKSAEFKVTNLECKIYIYLLLYH